MKRALFTFAVCVGISASAGSARADAVTEQRSATQAEILDEALRNGPATPRMQYRSAATPTVEHMMQVSDAKPPRSLNQREIGMLLGGSTGYAEYKASYAQVYQRYQTLLRASAAPSELSVADAGE